MSNSLLAYINPVAHNLGSNFPAANVNDPFGLGTMSSNPKYDYDIVANNYLDKSKTFNMFFTVTGPVDPLSPITSQLTSYGYSSNGSQVVWTVSPFGVFPPPLVDKYGTHPYMMYNAADGAADSIKTAQYSFLGGIVNNKYSCGKTIAYIRFFSMDAPDGPLYELTVRPLTFGNPKLPFKAQAIFIDAFAALLTKLNSYKPTKYIIDSRFNAGGMDQAARAIASLFGTTRPAGYSAAAWAINQSASSIPILPDNLTTVGGSIKGDSNKVEADAVAAVYPQAAVRSTKGAISVIFLNSIHAKSGGDDFPHYFIGPSGKCGPQKIGGNIVVQFVGDVDGRLFSGLKYYDSGPINTLNPGYVLKGRGPVSPLLLSVEAEFVFFDRLGSMANYQKWLQPALLLPGWYDQTIWMDLGKLKPEDYTVPYPFGLCDAYPAPDDDKSSSWRDIWLESGLLA